MSTIVRGARNAFRNPIRTISVITLLGISTALALALFLANTAMKNRVVDLKASAATTLTINPAGAFGIEGGGEPLKSADVAKVKELAHVAEVGSILMTQGKATVSAGNGSLTEAPKPNTSLESSIEPGTIGRRNLGSAPGQPPASSIQAFKLPVLVSGLEGRLDRSGQPLKITSGTVDFSGPKANEALLGKGIAAKNNLKVGDTFTAYNQTMKVVGIFDVGSQFGNDAVYIPVATLQALLEQPEEISQIFARIDSIDNLEAAKTAITNALGSSRVDIISPAQSVTDALAALQGIQQIALTGMVVTLSAAAVITFLIMVMIVRERRREIGVLKAIGASNTKIVTQFVSEALVLTLCGAVVGVVLAASTSNQITGALVSVNAPVSDSADSRPGQGDFSRSVIIKANEGAETAQDLVKNIQTNVGLPLLLQGLGAAVLIAIVGSAVPAWLIAKVRPAEVMRGE